MIPDFLTEIETLHPWTTERQKPLQSHTATIWWQHQIYTDL